MSWLRTSRDTWGEASNPTPRSSILKKGVPFRGAFFHALMGFELGIMSTIEAAAAAAK